MILTETNQIRQALAALNNLGECVIIELLWEHFGTTITVVFNYIWTDDGKIRSDLAIEYPLVLRFRVVQELIVKNGLNSAKVTKTENMNWGLSEIAAAELVDDEKILTPYSNLPVSFHHLVFYWESGNRKLEARQIDVVFSTLEIEKLWVTEK